MIFHAKMNRLLTEYGSVFKLLISLTEVKIEICRKC